MSELPAHVQVFAKLLEKWELTITQAATLLGYDRDDDARNLLAGSNYFPQRDVKYRIRCFLEIRDGLISLFDDAKAEMDWLRESNEFLDGEKPMELILTGSIDNILLIKQLVARISGR